jgi:hypothetical protein
MTQQAQETASADEEETVELSFPASVDLVVLARFTAATVAARAGFDIDEIEDLRLAVDELCVSFGPLEWHRNVRLRFECSDDTVRIVGEFDPLGIRAIDSISAAPREYDVKGEVDMKRAQALSRQLLEALVDDHGEENGDGKQVAWLEKRRGSGEQ